MGKQRTITLTDRRPVKIEQDDWPIISQVRDDDYEGNDFAKHVQASAQGELDEYALFVRRHADGRHIVYGTYTEGWNSVHEGLDHAGEVTTGSDVEAAIRRVGETLDVPEQLIADCIANLPAEEL